MEISECNNKIKWDTFVSESVQGNVFCTTSFLDSIPDKYKLIILEDHENIILGAIIFKKENSILKAPYPFTLYQGILCSHEFQKMPFHKRSPALLSYIAIFLDYLEMRFERLSFCLSHTFEDLRAFLWFHYHEPDLGLFNINLRYTGILGLRSISDFESYLSSIRTVRRQEYRKALKEGFVVESTNEIEILNKMHELTFQRQGIIRDVKEETLLLNISKNALSKGFGELIICYDKKRNPASASLFLYDRSYGYYLFGANNPEFRKSGSGTFLILENIRRCMEKDLTGVDFVGINSPNRGDFKTSFNAKPTPYYVITWEKSKK